MQHASSLRFAVSMLLLSWIVTSHPALAADGCRAADVDSNGTINIFDVLEITNNIGQVSPRLDLDGNGAVGEEDAWIVLDFFARLCPSCPGDLNADGTVDAADRALLEAAAGRDCRADLTRDDLVGENDAEVALVYFAAPPFTPHSAEARADFDGNGTINIFDVLKVINDVGIDCRVDLNKDGRVDTADVWFLLAAWGTCP